MPKVKLWGTLKAATGGETELEVEAATINEVLLRLGEAYPNLQPYLDRGVSVSVDGVIYAEDRFQPVGPDSEVFILPRMAGG